MTSYIPVTLSDVRWLLTKAKPTTCLSDTIPTMLLKRYPEAFLLLILRLIKLSLTSGTFTLTWRRTIVKALLKKIGLENIFKHYRPVNNFILKLLESAVLLQMQECLYTLNLLPQYQSSYRVNFFMETLHLKLIDDILRGWKPRKSQPW